MNRANTKIFLGVALLACAFAQPTQAQLPIRDVGAILLHTQHYGESWKLRIASKSDQLKWSTFAPGIPAIVAAMPFDRAGGIAELGNDRFLLSGLDSTTQTGRLVRVHLNPATSSIVIEGVATYTQFDPYELLYYTSENRIYMRDIANGRLFAVDYGDILNEPLPTQSAWVEIATLNDIHALKDYTGNMVHDPSLPGIVYGLPHLHDPNSDNQWGVRKDPGTGWQVSVVPPPSEVLLPSWAFSDLLPNANGPVQIQGFQGPYSVLQLGSSTPIVVAATSSAQPELIPLPGQGLTPGAEYVITGTPGVVSTSARKVFNSRWGTRLPGTNIELLPDSTVDLHVNNSEHTLTGRVLWSDGSRTDTAVFPVVMWVSFNTGDPVVYLPNGEAILQNVIAYYDPIQVSVEGKLHGHYSFSMPIPDDPNLIDTELLFQFAAMDGTDIVLSDVFGSLVFAESTNLRSGINSTYKAKSTSLNKLLGANSGQSRRMWMSALMKKNQKK